MPKTSVVFFKDKDGSVPVLDWLDGEVARRNRRAAAKCRAWLNLLKSNGRDLRRPIADYLRDDIYELRIQLNNINYRLLYFFSGNTVAVVSHGIVKESKVPDKEIELARERKVLFESDPEEYSYEEENV